jgi:hypothetical protein
VETAEEADLIWKWVTSGRVVLIDSTAPFFLPRVAVPVLAAA